MPAKVRTDPCFCSEKCPRESRPFRKYFVKTSATEFPEYAAGVIYEFKTDVGLTCTFAPIEDVFAPGPLPNEEQLIHQGLADVGETRSFSWRLNLIKQGVSCSFEVVVTWDDDDEPSVPDVAPSCSADYALPSIAGTCTVNATIEGVPNWACPGYVPP